jgi:hypothetical protein
MPRLKRGICGGVTYILSITSCPLLHSQYKPGVDTSKRQTITPSGPSNNMLYGEEGFNNQIGLFCVG